MKKFKIEKGIAIPDAGRTNNCKWPFNDMGVGDSCIVIPLKEYTREIHTFIANAARSYGWTKNPRWKYATRKTAEGLRVWRIL